MVELDPQSLCQAPCLLGHLHAHGQHNQVEGLVDEGPFLVLVPEHYVSRVGILLERWYPVAHVADAVLLSCLPVVVFVALLKALMSIMKIVHSVSGSCSQAMMASLVAYMQHTEEP